MRTPEELARIVSILDGIVRPTTAETIEYVLLNEARTEAHRLETQEELEQEMLNSLSGQAKPKWVKPQGFSKDMLIEILQQSVLMYQQYNAGQEIIDATLVRLNELQGKGKK
jgi:hypothetical protein